MRTFQITQSTLRTRQVSHREPAVLAMPAIIMMIGANPAARVMIPKMTTHVRPLNVAVILEMGLKTGV
jgi:hypothetical protein